MSKVCVIVSLSYGVLNDCTVYADKKDALREMEQIEMEWEGKYTKTIEIIEKEDGVFTTVQIYDDDFDVKLIEMEVK